MRVFLGGPIQFMIGDPVLMQRMRMAVLNLVETLRREGFEVFSAHLTEEFGKTTSEWAPSSIAQRDFDWMQRCDVFVALLPRDQSGLLARTDGTHVELGWASALGKPIVIVYDPRVAEAYSQLVQGLPAIAEVKSLEYERFMAEPELLVGSVREMVPQPRASLVPCAGGSAGT